MSYSVLQAAAGFGGPIEDALLCPGGNSTWDPITKTCVPKNAGATYNAPTQGPQFNLGPLTFAPPRPSTFVPPSLFVPSDPSLPATPVTPPAAPPPVAAVATAGGGMDLWNGLSTGEKVAVVAAGALGLLVVGVLVKKTMRKNGYTANRKGSNSDRIRRAFITQQRLENDTTTEGAKARWKMAKRLGSTDRIAKRLRREGWLTR